MTNEKKTRKKVLLTGATGFIGKYCLDELIKEGYDVIATYHAKPPAESYFKQVKCIQIDLVDNLKSLEEVLNGESIDILLHMAWDVSKGYQNSAKNFLWLEKSLELINLFIKCGGKYAVTVGSCFEYASSSRPYKEDDAISSSTLYGECKGLLYMAARQACQAKQVQYAHMRIFYPFGLGENKMRVIPYVIDELLAGRVPKCSSGVQVLDYMCAEDVARAIVKCLKSNVQGPVNIGSGEGVELRNLLTFINDKIDGDARIVFAEETPADRKVEIADISKLRETTGFVPSISRETAILRYIAQRKEIQKDNG